MAGKFADSLRLVPRDGGDGQATPDPHLGRLGRRLDRQLALSPAEHRVLAQWLGRATRTVREGTPLIERGAVPNEINVVVDGWAARCRTAPNGRRHILAFHLPGDLCEINAFVIPAMDSTIQALTRVEVACIDRAALDELAADHPRLSDGLRWQSHVAATVAREWAIGIGHRNARQRIAHLLCELVTRGRRIDLFDGRTMPLPLTQFDLGDACAMTAEHTNRSLRDLRDAELIALSRGRLEILDWSALVSLAGFDERYLDGRG